MRQTRHAAWPGFAAGLCFFAYLFPYLYLPGVWWRAIPSTGVILLLGALVYGRDADKLFGLRMSPKELVISIALFLILLPAFSYLVFSVVVVEPLSAQRYRYPLWQVHQFFQVFNDEILLRAALLTVLLRVFPHPKTAIVGTALAFSVGHHLLYRLNGIAIDWPAMVTLFSFGAITNALFLRFRHIGYGLALHYAWNFYRFNSAYSLHGKPLTEGMTFNYVEGHAWVAGGSLIVSTLVLAWYWHVEQGA